MISSGPAVLYANVACHLDVLFFHYSVNSWDATLFDGLPSLARFIHLAVLLSRITLHLHATPNPLWPVSASISLYKSRQPLHQPPPLVAWPPNHKLCRKPFLMFHLWKIGWDVWIRQTFREYMKPCFWIFNLRYVSDLEVRFFCNLNANYNTCNVSGSTY